MKKVLAMILALVMALSLVACSNGGTDKPDDNTETKKIKVGFITLHDENSTYDLNFINAAKEACQTLGLVENEDYFIKKNVPEGQECYNAAAELAEQGCNIIFADSFGHESFMIEAAKEFPNVSFVFVDGYPITEEAGVDGSPVLKNVAGIAFKEEQCGYLAGYAVVKEGFTKLGFTGGGGGTNPACCRYGYGFVQGADAAAKELGVKVDMNYSWQYGASFSASPELQTMVSGWYEAGTEVVFACGGSMFASVAAAAGGFMGVSSITTFVESTSGAADGGRTGLTSVTTGVLFILAAFFSPIVTIVSSAATCGALVYVGYLMMSEASEIDWSDVSQGFPAFMIVAGVPFTYSISAGIGLGFIAYVIVALFKGEASKIKPLMWIAALAFLVYFFVA